jgi:hypothetical protein
MRPRFEEVRGWTVTTPPAVHRSARASAREPERRGRSASASQAIQLYKSWVSRSSRRAGVFRPLRRRPRDPEFYHEPVVAWPAVWTVLAPSTYCVRPL